jgi:hypothetical protein
MDRWCAVRNLHAERTVTFYAVMPAKAGIQFWQRLRSLKN